MRLSTWVFEGALLYAVATMVHARLACRRAGGHVPSRRWPQVCRRCGAVALGQPCGLAATLVACAVWALLALAAWDWATTGVHVLDVLAAWGIRMDGPGAP